LIPACSPNDDPTTTDCDQSWEWPGDPGWGTGLISMATRVWMEYGDVPLLAELYPHMVAYITNLLSLADPTSGLLTFGDFGDWLPPFLNDYRVDMPIVSSYWLHRDLNMLADIAALLNQSSDSTKVCNRECGVSPHSMYQKRTWKGLAQLQAWHAGGASASPKQGEVCEPAGVTRVAS
jgi:hypothetical protein